MVLTAPTDEVVNILLVDDTPNNLIALSALLNDGNYRITTATSGHEALAHLERTANFAVILTDIMMPGMDGYELAKIIKSDPRFCDISIIFVTAKVGEVAEIFRAYEVGGVDYLQKPLEPEVVKAKVAVFAQLFRQQEMIKRQAKELIEAAQREQSYHLKELKNKAAQERKRSKSLERINEELEGRVKCRTDELQRREAQLRLITNCMPVVVMELDEEERLLFLNDACQTTYALSNGNLVDSLGKSLKELLSDQDYAYVKPFIARALAGEEVNFEHQIIHQDGRKLSFSIACVPEFAVGERVNGVVIVGMDITKHKKTEAALLLAKISADAANAAKSAFLANMSHEIRTPLGAVLGFSELLLSPDTSPFERPGYLAAMKRNGELLSKLINDILDLSKVEAGKLEVERRDVLLDDVLTDVTTLLKLSAAEKGIALALTCAADVPETINTDSLRLRQILLNIVGNAIKFTKRGSVRVHVSREVGDGDTAQLAFAVTDTGPGISPEQAARLFEPFTQADASTKRINGGTGLGLALSRRLARVLGGELSLDASHIGSGSTFTIRIDPGPIACVDPATPCRNRGRAATRNEVQTLSRLDGLCVLLVDDAADNRLLVGRYLRMAGAIVETAVDGAAALVKVRENNGYDAVLMDLQMPEMDGYEATAELRRQGHRMPIIALTAHALNEERSRCLAAGFDDHICKPVDRFLLCEKLRYFIAEHAATAGASLFVPANGGLVSPNKSV